MRFCPAWMGFSQKLGKKEDSCFRPPESFVKELAVLEGSSPPRLLSFNKYIAHSAEAFWPQEDRHAPASTPCSGASSWLPATWMEQGPLS